MIKVAFDREKLDVYRFPIDHVAQSSAAARGLSSP